MDVLRIYRQDSMHDYSVTIFCSRASLFSPFFAPARLH